ncbi:MAG TPA: flagellar basal body P-ring formation protein FlgA [Gammaproteobacteria bacterium]|nr:flagellar basal body P-ring formation protein FlgA [Gammaproteobacteria bacterium]
MHPRLVVFCLLAALSGGALAGDYQPLDEIRRAAEHFVLAQATGKGRLEVTVGRLDRRLHLPRCSRPLQAFLPQGSPLAGNTTIGIACPAGKAWKVFVPARIKRIQRVLVASRPLIRGSRLQPGDLEYAERDIAGLQAGYFTNDRELAGKILKQAVMAGKVIAPTMLDAPRLVRRGQDVTIMAVSEGFEIRMKGKAMMDGRAGETIKVENLKSRRIVEGEVVAASVVKVPL